MMVHANTSFAGLGAAASKLAGDTSFEATSIIVETGRNLSEMLSTTKSGWLRLPSKVMQITVSERSLASECCSRVLSGEGVLDNKASSWRVVSSGKCVLVTEGQMEGSTPVLRQNVEVLGNAPDLVLMYAIYWARINGGIRRVAWRFCGYGDTK